jgi:Flp pilus assembly protein TadB
MPAWLIPVLKSVLPYVGTIISAAAPVFTKKSADAAANQSILQQQQITELQAAASGNDAHIKALATQMQNTVEALEKGASLAEKRHQLVIVLCISAIIISVISLGTALYVITVR